MILHKLRCGSGGGGVHFRKQISFFLTREVALAYIFNLFIFTLLCFGPDAISGHITCGAKREIVVQVPNVHIEEQRDTHKSRDGCVA